MLNEAYECKCQTPRPLTYLKQDTGLCGGCNLIYDSRLYEMRLREHVSGFTWDSLDEFLTEVDPAYRALQNH
jgi:hypothetical protein